MTHDPLANLRGPRCHPAPGGADLAVTAGRRRLLRRRTTTAAAGVSLGVVATAAFAGTRHGPSAGLAPAGRLPRAAATGTPSPALPSAAFPSALPGLPSALPTDVYNPAPSGSPTDAPDPVPSPTSEAPRPYLGLGDRTMRVSMSNDPTACADVNVEWTAQTGFCTKMTGPKTLHIGTPETYAFSLCRVAGQPATTLTFSTREAQIGANRSDIPPEWSLTDDSPKHTVAFGSGDCRTWTVTWMGQDDAGYAVAPDQYEVLGWSPADEWTDENTSGMPPPPASVFVDVS